MKRIISILLVSAVILMMPLSVLATESAESVTENSNADIKSYNLEELFVDYKEYSLDEMIGFLRDNPRIEDFLYWIRATRGGGQFNNNFMFFVHLEREGSLTGSERVPKVEYLGVNEENSADYLLSTARVVAPDTQNTYLSCMSGEMGNRKMTVELLEGFADYICSFERAEGNRIILNFIMNIFGSEDVVGVSWYDNYTVYFDPSGSKQGDYNGDGAVNVLDGNIIRRILSGNTYTIDPFAADMNGDGKLNSKDSLILQKKLVNG